MKSKARQFAGHSSDAANARSSKRSQSSEVASFVDNSARTSSQQQLIDSIQSSGPAVAQAKQLQGMFGPTAQLVGNPDEEMVGQKKSPEDDIQKKEADGGASATTSIGSTSSGLP